MKNYLILFFFMFGCGYNKSYYHKSLTKATLSNVQLNVILPDTIFNDSLPIPIFLKVKNVSNQDIVILNPRNHGIVYLTVTCNGLELNHPLINPNIKRILNDTINLKNHDSILVRVNFSLSDIKSIQKDSLRYHKWISYNFDLKNEASTKKASLGDYNLWFSYNLCENKYVKSDTIHFHIRKK